MLEYRLRRQRRGCIRVRPELVEAVGGIYKHVTDRVVEFGRVWFHRPLSLRAEHFRIWHLWQWRLGLRWIDRWGRCWGFDIRVFLLWGRYKEDRSPSVGFGWCSRTEGWRLYSSPSPRD